MLYIRFVINTKDEDSGRRQGIFQALGELEDEGVLYEYEIKRKREINQWFDKNLKVPYSFSRSSKFHAHKKAISWFKDSAFEHIKKMRDLAAILSEHDVAVETIQTERPGYIVYEDQFQITAEPFKETEA